MLYKIRNFIPETHAAVIAYGDNFETEVSINIPMIGDRLLEDSALDLLIQSVLLHHKQQNDKKKLVTNLDSIISKVEPVQEFNKQETNIDALTKSILLDRWLLLRNTDWTQLNDCALSDGDVTAWKTYRQELRDIPMQNGYPLNIIWPIPPSPVRNGERPITNPDGSHVFGTTATLLKNLK
jgi:hypothetical protein